VVAAELAQDLAVLELLIKDSLERMDKALEVLRVEVEVLVKLVL
jgi:hypothetical protein